MAYSPRGDWRFEDGPRGPRVVIPTRPAWWEILFMLVVLSLTGWALFRTPVLRAFIGQPDLFSQAFMFCWLTGWSAVGAAASFRFLNNSGLVREVLWRDGERFCQSWEIIVLRRTRRHHVHLMGSIMAYDLSREASTIAEGGVLAVSHTDDSLRPAGYVSEKGSAWRLGNPSGGLFFSSGTDIVRLGVGLDTGQTARLLELLRDRFHLRVSD